MNVRRQCPPLWPTTLAALATNLDNGSRCGAVVGDGRLLTSSTPLPLPPMDASPDQIDAPLDADAINRLWQHGLHEEKLFHDRLNYFSAIQVGLLGVFAILYNKEASLGVFVPLAAIGLAFALLWLRVQLRHWRYCKHVYARMKRAVREYAGTVATMGTPGLADGLSIARPLAVAVPVLFAMAWVALFGFVLLRAGE